jgi:hypothetical protein
VDDGPLTVCLVALFCGRFDILVSFVGGGLSLRRRRRRPDDLAQPYQTVVEAAGAHRWRGGGALGVLFDAEGRQVSGDRALEMPRWHDVLLPLGRGLLVPLSADGLLVLVRGQDDADAILLASLARRAGHLQVVAGFAASLLGSSVQRKVFGDILRYVKAATHIATKKKQKSERPVV